MPDDPLEAIQLRILERPAAQAEPKQPAAKPAQAPTPSRGSATATKIDPAADAAAAKPKRASPGRRAAKPSAGA